MFKKIISLTVVIALVVVTSGIMNLTKTMAASLTSMSDTVTNLSAATVANHTIQFTTPTGIAAGATLILTFDNSTSIPAGLDYTDVDLKDDGVDATLNSTAAGTAWGVARTSVTVITFTNGSTAVTGGSVVNIEIGTNATSGSAGDQQITNGSAGTTTLSFSGTFGDSGVLSMPIITNSIVAISATVLPTISFTISDNTIYFGNLRTGGPCFAQGSDPGNVTCPTQAEAEAFNMTAATNGTGGYTISAQGATLTSNANTITPNATNQASNPGNEQFGMRATATSGSGAVLAPFLASGFAWTPTATTPVNMASSSVATTTTTYSVRYIANISPTTESGSYTASHTYIATGNF